MTPGFADDRLRPMWKRLLHWLIAAALVLQVFSCVFLGRSEMPAMPF